ncbi:uncharacterized protein LOC133460763 isoform X3 [Cololabis saira]|nr:uncharacterized protein LOC133460763 isoform X3 [Cololabis saira]
MTHRVQKWRKLKRNLEQLLRRSDSSDQDSASENPRPASVSGDGDRDSVSAPGTPDRDSVSAPGTPDRDSVSAPGTPDRDSVSAPGTPDRIDFETDFDCTDSESESMIADPEVTSSFEEELRQWALEHKLTHRAINGLLPILRKQGHLLPLDCRTLLGTPQTSSTEPKCGGQYKYYGLEKGIRSCLRHLEGQDVHLSVNIDGIPLFKSSGVQCWPILGKCGKFDPFIIAIFSGTKKPSPPEEYLRDFLTEYAHLKQDGITFEGHTYSVTIDSLICDAPARAFLKCIKGHTSYESCERCITRGIRVDGRIVFTGDESTSRTDDGFSKGEYFKNHQQGRSPFITAGVPCVTSFVLDYMHMVCLGVVRRMLVYLTRGPKICRLSARQKETISEKLVALRGKMPSDFARQPRALHELDRWKATELRQFLLYTGPVVLKNVLSLELYQHFVSFTVAMSILLESDDRIRQRYLQYAQDLLKHFVRTSARLYGETFPVYNVHGLTHLHEDVRHFQCSLNEVSCFPFENYLQKIKKHVRSGKSPLEQVTRRLAELEHSGVNMSATKPRKFASIKTKDCCFLLKDQQFAFIRQQNADGSFECEILHQRHTSPFFSQPCSSGLLDIVCTANGQVRMRNAQLLERDLYRKVACLPREAGGFVLMPLRHSLEHYY